MAEHIRRRVGRPRTRTYETVQVKCDVHPNIRRLFEEQAAKRGLTLYAHLTELVAKEAGVPVQDLLAEDQEVLPTSA